MNLENIALIRSITLRKNGTRLRLIHTQITLARTVMPQQETPYPGIACTFRRLRGRTVMVQTRLVGIFMSICGFMIQCMHAAHPGCKFRERLCITAIGVTHRLKRQIGRMLGRRHAVKTETIAFYPVPQRKRRDSDMLGAMHNLRPRHCERMKYDGKTVPLPETCPIEIQYRSEILGCIYMQVFLTPEHRHRRQESEQPEQMITMYVRYADSLDFQH